MSDHEHHDHSHKHDHGAPVTPEDAGSQALAEALGSSFAIVKVVMVLMVVIFFCSGFFTVGPQEKAVILRFGKLVGEGAAIGFQFQLHALQIRLCHVRIGLGGDHVGAVGVAHE